MIVVADTSVILNLCRVQHEHLLQALYQRVLIPQPVADEFYWLTKTQTRFSGLVLPSWIEVLPTPKVVPMEVVQGGLDAGESAAIALCIEKHADAVLMDESLGREVATKLKVRTVGILGILIDAKNLQIISSVKELLDRLQTEANFWVAPGLKFQVLKIAGE